MGLCGFCAADGQAGEEHSRLCVAQRLTEAAAYRARRVPATGRARAMLDVLAFESLRLVEVIRDEEVT